MNSNVIMFPLFIETEKEKPYYSMLYYALKTLTKNYNKEFDIVVYFYSSTYNIFDHKNFLNNEKNIFTDFPQVKFIQLEYKQLHETDGYFFKWKAVDHLFSIGYKKAFVLDVDVVFFKNPAQLFEEYDNDHAHILKESPNPTIIKILGKPAINGGQIILSKKLYEIKIRNIYQKMLAHRDRLLLIAEAILDEPGSYMWFKRICDQYALFETLIECEVPMSLLRNKDISFGDECYKIKVKNNSLLIIPESDIVHYFGINAAKILPRELLPSEFVDIQNHYLAVFPQATNEEVNKWFLE